VDSRSIFVQTQDSEIPCGVGVEPRNPHLGTPIVESQYRLVKSCATVAMVEHDTIYRCNQLLSNDIGVSVYRSNVDNAEPFSARTNP